MKELPKHSQSYWTEFIKDPNKGGLDSQAGLETDVTVIGAGITGILTAYLLATEGKKVALVEAGQLMNGTTGHTTAKITAQHGLIYDKLISNMDEKMARLYYEANLNGLGLIQSLIEEKQIECDFSVQDSITYAVSEETEKQVQLEYEAYQKLGIPGDLVKELPLPFPIKNALIMPKQAQFHPVKFLNHILKAFVDQGGLIFDNTPVEAIENDEAPFRVIAKNHSVITSKQVVITTHYPFFDMEGLYFSRLHAVRSYIVAATIEGEIQEGMYLSADQPTRSIRYTNMDGEKLVLFGGESHKTGQSENPLKHFESLKDFAEKYYTLKDIPYRWSAQDLVTLDQVPYIGQYSSKKDNLYIATGFAKWGMSNGASAALLLKDMVMGRVNPYQELFTPTRSEKKLTNLATFLKENANVAKEFVKGKLSREDLKPEELLPDEGGIVKYDGKRAGAYKNSNGEISIVDTTCTHMGCELKWNNGERSWDCPCHGSRFSPEGEVLEGPAVKPLKKLK